MTGQATDRRGFVRIPFTTEVEIDAGGSRIHAEGEVNISMSGIRVPYAGSLPPAAACRLTITLNSSKDPVAIRAEGRILRSDAGSLAVEFTQLDPDSYGHLRQLILNNAADPERAEQEFDSHWGIRPRT